MDSEMTERAVERARFAGEALQALTERADYAALLPRRISSRQLARAFALAVSFDHDWGRIDPKVIEAICAAGGCTYKEILGEYLLSETNKQGGISPPMPSADGVVSHETGTGRCRYIVTANGAVTVEIRRPGRRVVLRGEVSPEGKTRIMRVGDAFWRHWDAMIRVLRALGSEFTLPPAIERAHELCLSYSKASRAYHSAVSRQETKEASRLEAEMASISTALARAQAEIDRIAGGVVEAPPEKPLVRK